MLNRSPGIGSTVPWGVACAATLACSMATAQGVPADDSSGAPRLEVSGQAVVRLDSNDQGATRLEAVGWAGRGPNSFGVAVGSTLDRWTPAPRPASPEPAQASMDVGVRWRSAVNSRQRLDVAAWRAVSGEVDDRPALTTRVEMQFTAPRSKSFAELGAIGMQLSGDSRVTLKIRKGRPMFYYRSKF